MAGKMYFKKAGAYLLALIMVFTLFAGLGAGRVKADDAVQSLQLVEAQSFEAGKEYVILNSEKNTAMSAEQGYSLAYRKAAAVTFSNGTLTYNGDTADLIWKCKEGTDSLIKLYNQKRLDAGNNAFLHYSGCDMVTETNAGGEQHSYNATGCSLSSWYSDTIYYLYFSENVGFGKAKSSDISYYDSKIYLYEVQACAHADKDFHEQVDADCENAGTVAYYECKTCGKKFSDEQMTSELKENDLVITALGHNWGEGTVAKQPTSTSSGIMTYTCSRCSQTKNEEILPSGISDVIKIKPDKAESLENGKQYIFLSYPNGCKVIQAKLKALYESGYYYNYLTGVSAEKGDTTITFDSAEVAKLCIFTAEESESVKGEFALRNGYGDDAAWLHRNWQMFSLTDKEEASYFTYNIKNYLKDAHPQPSNDTSVYVTFQNNVYKGWTNVTSPVYAYEVVNETMDEYTVNFETNGGTAVSSVTVKNGEKVKKPEAPKKDDYEFVGWYSDKDLSVEYDFDSPVTESMTLYAKWESTTGDSNIFNVQRVLGMSADKKYIIVNVALTMALSTDTSDGAVNSNARAPMQISFSEDGTQIIFKSIEEKNKCVWESEAGTEAGHVALINNGKYLGSKYSALHWPADVDEEGELLDNIYFSIEEDDYVKTDGSTDLTTYTLGYDAYFKGFMCPENKHEMYVFEIVDEENVHEHKLVKVNEVPATCTETGIEAYWKCSSCGMLFEDEAGTKHIVKPEIISATGHEWGDWTKLNDNQHQKTCTHDSNHKETAFHNWDSGKVTKEATETTEGEMTYTCTDCGAVKIEAIAPKVGDCPAAGTPGYIVEAVAADELESGENYIVLASDRTKAMTSENIVTEYGGHRLKPADIQLNEDDGRITFATSTDAGLAMWKCEGSKLTQITGELFGNWAYIWCGDSSYYDGAAVGNMWEYKYNEETGKGKLTQPNSNYAIGFDNDYNAFCANTDLYCSVYKVTDIKGLVADGSHNLEKTAAKDPTCTENGNTEYYTCTKCHQIFEDSKAEKQISAEDTVIKALGHELKLTSAKAALCEEEGNTAYYTCERCGHFFEEKDAEKEIEEGGWITAAIGHDWDEGKVTTDPSCTEEGVKTYICKNDSSHTKTEKVEATGHNWVQRAVYDATCTEDGYTLYECSVCHETEKRNEKKATGHVPAEPVSENLIEAGCETAGSYDEVVKCSVCGEVLSRKTVEISATGHDWDDGVWTWADDLSDAVLTFTCENDPEHINHPEVTIAIETAEPGIETAGKTVYTATAEFEGKTYSDTKENIIPPVGHDYVFTEWIWTADEEAGYKVTAVFTDKNDGSALEIEAKVSVSAVQATCTEDGSIEYSASVIFDNTVYEDDPVTEVIPATGHTPAEAVRENAKEATCETAGGYDEIIKCSVCGETISSTKVEIPATGHTAAEAVRENAKEATCETAGGYDELIKCSVCGEILSSTKVEIPATGHDWDDGKITKAATCTDNGEKTYTCKNDSKHTKTEDIPAIGHDWDDGVWTWAEDKSSAEILFTCKTDDNHTQKIAAAVAKEQTKAATKDAEGEMTYTATVEFGGETYTDTAKEIIPKLDDEEPTNPDNPGGDEPGKQDEPQTIAVSSITLTPGSAAMASSSAEKDSVLKIEAKVAPENATDKKLNWSSSNKAVAEVDAEGNVRALSYGTAVITAADASGKVKGSCSINVKFYDVNGTNIKGKDGYQYYYDAVYWAANKGITKGYGITLSDGTKVADSVYFGPTRKCQRREMMIFLWRLAGSPVKDGKGNSYGDARNYFNDLKAYGTDTDTNKAIAWGYKEGIVKGYSDGSFHPKASILRKDTMIMLYRRAGKPAVSGKTGFSDVDGVYKTNTDTYRAILWGSRKGITYGYDSGTYVGKFGTMLDCLREHIVTFIYRYQK